MTDNNTFNGFPKEGLDFLDEIVLNNSKAWLDANRDRYEQYIVEPSKAYVAEMGSIYKFWFLPLTPFQK